MAEGALETTALERAHVAAEHLVSVLNEYRFRPAGELELQDGLERIFAQRGVRAAREHRLSGNDVVDFFLPEGVAVEVKVKGGALAVARQLQRYACNGGVLALLLVTTREALARGLPAELGGKRLFKVALGGGF